MTFVDADGKVHSQSGGLTVRHAGVGEYVVDLGQPVAAKAFIATPNWQLATTSRIDASASPCGTDAAAGEYDCGISENDGRHVIVATADSFGNASGSQDEAFYFVALP